MSFSHVGTFQLLESLLFQLNGNAPSNPHSASHSCHQSSLLSHNYSTSRRLVYQLSNVTKYPLSRKFALDSSATTTCPLFDNCHSPAHRSRSRYQHVGYLTANDVAVTTSQKENFEPESCPLGSYENTERQPTFM